ncbi:MAG: hypothetical protein IPL23_30645 [Saprospiraceae bacterium]|nr:hypothetical protein [Saprospiraceae bacterium]
MQQEETAHNVSIQDLLPNGLTNITNITGGASISGNLITWIRNNCTWR